ncbi:hypothetical protein G7054_g9220 [Neopestalotiopsis clavispora]|nr:hypothetical protein G7054_g9220 [Neopestalotiopsis clavispora]
MTISDFFTFDEFEYAQRISDVKEYPNERLIKQEVVKLRQGISCSWSIGAGIGAAIPTFGGSLAVLPISIRRKHVAKKKNALITAELIKRGVQPHTLQKRDFIIPIVAGVVGLGVGCGLEQVAAEVTNVTIMAAHVPTGSSAIHEVIQHPGDAFNAFDDGIAEQTREVALALHDTTQGIVPGSDLSHAVLQSHTTWVSVSPAEAVGFYHAMLAAQVVEKSAVSSAANQCAWWMTEALSAFFDKGQHLRCPRLLGGFVTCNQCGETVTAGTFWRA